MDLSLALGSLENVGSSKSDYRKRPRSKPASFPSQRCSTRQKPILHPSKSDLHHHRQERAATKVLVDAGLDSVLA